MTATEAKGLLAYAAASGQPVCSHLACQPPAHGCAETFLIEALRLVVVQAEELDRLRASS